jgi:vitellogenic carboxypeptidase-like protein
VHYNIEQKNFIEAFHIFDALINGDLTNSTSYFYNVTGINKDFNYLITNDPTDQDYFIPFITRADQRKEIHVGNISFSSQNDIVERMLLNDLVRILFNTTCSLIIIAFIRCKVSLGRLQLY